MKNLLKFGFLATILLLSSVVFSQNGSIKGKIIDANTNEAIIGANVIISGTSKGTSSDIEGNFEISGLEPGFYSVTASFLGYRSETKTEIQVTNSRPAFIDFVLEEEGTDQSKEQKCYAHSNKKYVELVLRNEAFMTRVICLLCFILGCHD